MKRQLTATTYIIDTEEAKVLLIYHRKFNKWMPPGGHVDENETFTEAAIREAKEETGLKVEIIRQENLWLKNAQVQSEARPYLCLLEEIPATIKEEAHQHLDMIFVARPVGKELIVNERETKGIGWFSLADVEQLADDLIFSEVKEIIGHLLSQKV